MRLHSASTSARSPKAVSARARASASGSPWVGLFVAPLQRLGLDYMVTGGVAAVAYGDPRFTRDVDIVLALARGEVDSFAGAFSEPDFYLPRREVLTEEISRRKGGTST